MRPVIRPDVKHIRMSLLVCLLYIQLTFINDQMMVKESQTELFSDSFQTKLVSVR